MKQKNIPKTRKKNKSTGLLSNQASSIWNLQEYDSVPLVDIISAAHTEVNYMADAMFYDFVHIPKGLLKEGQHLWVTVPDESMGPTLHAGSFILIRLLASTEWEQVSDKKMYVIVDPGHKALIKRLKFNAKTNSIHCSCDNPDKAVYPEFSLKVNEIRSIWEAQLYLVNQLPPLSFDIIDED